MIFCVKSRFIGLLFYLLDDFGRHTSNNRIGLYVFGHYSTSSNNGSIADGHASQHRCVGSNPYIFADMDGGIAHALTLGGVEIVVDGCQYDVVTDEAALVDGDATLILELLVSTHSG